MKGSRCGRGRIGRAEERVVASVQSCPRADGASYTQARGWHRRKRRRYECRDLIIRVQE